MISQSTKGFGTIKIIIPSYTKKFLTVPRYSNLNPVTSYITILK